jgi:hypothetical protein
MECLYYNACDEDALVHKYASCGFNQAANLCIFYIRVFIVLQDIVCHLQLIRCSHSDCPSDVLPVRLLLHLLQLHCITLTL